MSFLCKNTKSLVGGGRCVSILDDCNEAFDVGKVAVFTCRSDGQRAFRHGRQYTSTLKVLYGGRCVSILDGYDEAFDVGKAAVFTCRSNGQRASRYSRQYTLYAHGGEGFGIFIDGIFVSVFAIYSNGLLQSLAQEPQVSQLFSPCHEPGILCLRRAAVHQHYAGGNRDWLADGTENRSGRRAKNQKKVAMGRRLAVCGTTLCIQVSYICEQAARRLALHGYA